VSSAAAAALGVARRGGRDGEIGGEGFGLAAVEGAERSIALPSMVLISLQRRQRILRIFPAARSSGRE